MRSLNSVDHSLPWSPGSIFCLVLFFSKFYPQCGSWTHDPDELKRPMLYLLSQSGAPLGSIWHYWWFFSLGFDDITFLFSSLALTICLQFTLLHVPNMLTFFRFKSRSLPHTWYSFPGWDHPYFLGFNYQQANSSPRPPVALYVQLLQRQHCLDDSKASQIQSIQNGTSSSSPVNLLCYWHLYSVAQTRKQSFLTASSFIPSVK